MLIRTHLAITICGILLLFNYVNNQWVFVAVSLVATFIPDVDSRFSTFGHKYVARVLQILTKHRGMIHSFSFLFTITLLLVLFFPILALGFFLGYGLHLFADSFTPEGIKPFYPWKKKSSGFVTTGSKLEVVVFVVFVLVDVALFFGIVGF